jgi:hypothetical protein
MVCQAAERTMVKGPRGEKRSDDPATAAVEAVRIALGEIEEVLDPPPARKNPAAVKMGRKGGMKGGKARAEKLSDQERKDIARRAAQKRWADKS